MNYWVPTANASARSGVLDGFPENDQVPGYLVREGVPLAEIFPDDIVLGFSENFPNRRQLVDFMEQYIGAPVVSARIRDVLLTLKARKLEFLPVSICDHAGSALSNDYFILNSLDLQDAIDMEKSEVTMNPMEEEEERIYHVHELALTTDTIDPEALVFRPRNCPKLVLVNDTVKQALVAAGVTGLELQPAEGWSED